MSVADDKFNWFVANRMATTANLPFPKAGMPSLRTEHHMKSARICLGNSMFRAGRALSNVLLRLLSKAVLLSALVLASFGQRSVSANEPTPQQAAEFLEFFLPSIGPLYWLMDGDDLIRHEYRNVRVDLGNEEATFAWEWAWELDDISKVSTRQFDVRDVIIRSCEELPDDKMHSWRLPLICIDGERCIKNDDSFDEGASFSAMSEKDCKRIENAFAVLKKTYGDRRHPF